MEDDSILNKKFNRLTVRKYSDVRIGNRPTLVCDCECGNRNILVQRKKVLSGHTKSCGCLQKEIRKSRSISLVGKKFERLKVVSGAKQRDKKGCIIWKCKCGI